MLLAVLAGGLACVFFEYAGVHMGFDGIPATVPQKDAADQGSMRAIALDHIKKAVQSPAPDRIKAIRKFPRRLQSRFFIQYGHPFFLYYKSFSRNGQGATSTGVNPRDAAPHYGRLLLVLLGFLRNLFGTLLSHLVPISCLNISGVLFLL